MHRNLPENKKKNKQTPKQINPKGWARSGKRWDRVEIQGLTESLDMKKDKSLNVELLDRQGEQILHLDSEFHLQWNAEPGRQVWLRGSINRIE